MYRAAEARSNEVMDERAIFLWSATDTGATGKLTTSSAPLFKLQDGTNIGISYVVASIFEKWRRQHPNWRVLKNAEAVTGYAYPMIEVASIRVAEMSVGPVWFAERFDDDFHIGLSRRQGLFLTTEVS